MTLMKPMLAKAYKESWAKPGYFLQPKLDGVRMIWTGKEALSRTGKPILGCPGLVEILMSRFKGTPLDGELYNHEKSFQEQISSIRRTVNLEEDLSISYWVYDVPVAGVPFHERCKMLRSLVVKIPRVVLVDTVPGSNRPLNVFGGEFEGTMLRNADGLYAFGKRSSDLLKIKEMMEEDFECIGVTPYLEHEKLIVPPHTPGAKEHAGGVWKKNGKSVERKDMIGSLVCRTESGTEFEVGTGYTEEMRKDLMDSPPIGKQISVKFQELTDDGIPRFPVFKVVRDYE